MKRFIKNIIMVIMIILFGLLTYFTMNYAKDNLSVSNNLESNMNNTNTPPEKPDDNNSNNSNANNDLIPSMPNDGNMGSINNNTVSLTCVYYVLFGVYSLVIALLLVYLIMSGFNKKSFKETFNNKDKVIIYILSLIIFTTGFIYIDKVITYNCFLNNSSNGNMNNQGSSVTYSASKEITSDEEITDGEYSSDQENQNAILVSGDITAKLSNITVSKTGDSDGGDATSFYGNNSAILAKDKANLTLSNITVETNATGANGVFSYGGSATTNNSSSDGTVINISDSKITTKKDNSGGIMTTDGGIMNATNLIINTAGVSSAAIRTDRGGGEVTVNKGTYTTTGAGSPTIYSTANVKVSNAKLVSKASEGIVIEGKNSITIDNCNLTDTNNKLNGQSTTYKNIFLYQSMSGDASSGSATFTALNSTIKTNKGDTLYVTNTEAVINLTNNKITNKDSSGNFLRIQKDSWGNEGSNGGVVTLNMSNQEAIGNIVVDEISTLDINMKKASYYEGSINSSNTAKSIKLVLDKKSKIKLTGDSYISSLEDEDSSYSNIDFNGYKLYVNGTSIN